MEKKENSFLKKLEEMGLIQTSPNVGLNYIFNPRDYSIMKLSWNSPNDGLENVLDFSMNPHEMGLIKIKDKH
jgi:hypothetical protein